MTKVSARYEINIFINVTMWILNLLFLNCLYIQVNVNCSVGNSAGNTHTSIPANNVDIHE